jgi:putative Mg2+ transporter-C (MgtC) family protein
MCKRGRCCWVRSKPDAHTIGSDSAEHGTEVPDFSLSLFAAHGLKLFATFLLALPVGWEREASTRIMGLRTFPLVALASCAYVLVGEAIVGDDATGQARVISGLMAGIGFIGGGAILKQENRVQGTATAASIWSTGVLGAAVGYGLYEIAALVSLFTLATLVLLTPLERLMDGGRSRKGKRDES